MKYVELTTRELKEKDIQTVQFMVKDIWEGHDYVASVIDRWLADENCYTYGVFQDRQLVGMGNLRWLNENIAWMEGGRVYPPVQGKGIGTVVFKHAVDTARKKGVKKVQFSTATTNAASLKMADNNAFIRSTVTPVFWLAIENIKQEDAEGDIVEITSVRALSLLESVPNGPSSTRSVCTGWSYIPLEQEFIAKQAGSWFSLGEAIALAITWKSVQEDETKEYPRDRIWIILYGKAGDAGKLLQLVINKFKAIKAEGIQVFCHEALAPVVLEQGFIDRDNDAKGVVLLEKTF